MMLLDKIENERQGAVGRVFSDIYLHFRSLLEEEDCSYECSCMLFGSMAKGLRAHGLLEPQISRPYYGQSMAGIRKVIEGFRTPRSSRLCPESCGSHYCSMTSRLRPTLIEVEAALHVFNLEDYRALTRRRLR